MVHWAIAYSEPCQTSEMDLFAKIVISKEVPPCVDVLKGSEYASAECKIKCFASFLVYIAVYFKFKITFIFCHFNTIRFPFETLSILGFSDLSKIGAKIMENTYKWPFLGKVSDHQPAILSKKCIPFQISFNLFVYILGASPST